MSRRITDLIEIYIEEKLSLSEDAGWGGESVASKLITYLGDIPKSTGLDQSNMAMINAMNLMKDQHPDYKKIAHAMQEININQYTAIIAKHALVHINEETGKAYTDADRAYLVGQNVNTMKDNYRRGLKAVEEQVKRIERYEAIG